MEKSHLVSDVCPLLTSLPWEERLVIGLGGREKDLDWPALSRGKEGRGRVERPCEHMVDFHRHERVTKGS